MTTTNGAGNTMATELSDLLSQDVVDMRDVTDRVEELREEIEGDECEVREAEEEAGQDEEHKASPATCGECGRTWDDAVTTGRTPAPSARCPFEGTHDAVRELAQLTEILDELRGNGENHQWEGDWYPGSMISDGYFECYARDLADDIGAVNDDARWPNRHIDWSAAAEELKSDYLSIEIEGATWWCQ